MSKSTTLYICSECGNESLAWQGKCSYCQTWNSLKEISTDFIDTINTQAIDSGSKLTWTEQEVNSISLDLSNRALNLERIKLGDEIDRVLGGGLVPGSVLLLAGEPGIGKSTLLLQLAAAFASRGDLVCYISGEESTSQLAARAARLNIAGSAIKAASIASVDQIIKLIHKEQPKLLVVDSIQTIYDVQFPSAPGSIVQVRQSALKLTRAAKAKNIPLIISSHVTKEGTLAGPRTLEHMVDVVLYIEGERFHDLRLLRGVKNRYGPTDEVGVFEMKQQGLEPIDNPSEIFLSERQNNLPGSVVTAAMEGLRPFLLEVQALATPARFGYPKRSTIGINADRLELILAVLEKRAKVKVGDYDIFCNLVGGLTAKEPAIDVAVAVAVVSSIKNRAIDGKRIFFGEIGLTGEVRRVRFADRRRKEAERFGFEVSTEKDIVLLLQDLALG